MKKITDILTDFFSIMKNEIFEYYQKSYAYLKDLVAYKKIDLKIKTETESEKQIKNSLGKILKAIKTGLNTLGVSMDKLNKNQNHFLETLNSKGVLVPDYNSYFELYMEKYVYEVLFVILLEYLFDIDVKKLENVNLFDLLPDHFITKLNQFKNTYINSEDIKKEFQQYDYKSSINFTDLTFIESRQMTEPDILTQLREAKQDIIETLKTPKKELLRSSIENLKKEPIREDLIPSNKLITQNVPIVPLVHQSRTLPKINKDLGTLMDSNTFLDNIGHLMPINNKIANEIKIDKVNLINLKMVNPNFLDLENLFYYLSIIKMLNLESPFTNLETLEIIKQFINDRVFSSSKDNIPDSKNIFYGLAILSEMNFLDKTDIIDLLEIESFIKSELEIFIPEKLESNLYSLFCLKLIAKNRIILFNKTLIGNLIQNINLSNLEDFKPPLDIYHYLASLKLLDKEINLNQFKINYINEIKKLIEPNGSIRNLITDSALALLIFNLLDLKDHEQELCDNLLSYILNITKFFNKENLDRVFNWQTDKMGFKIELEILYWALLASSQYAFI